MIFRTATFYFERRVLRRVERRPRLSRLPSRAKWFAALKAAAWSGAVALIDS
jgi:hypothetical protein